MQTNNRLIIFLLLGLLSSGVTCDRSPLDYLLTAVAGKHGNELKWLRQQVEAKAGGQPQEVKSFLERAEEMAKTVASNKEMPPDVNDDTGVSSFEPRSSILTLWGLLDTLVGIATQEGFEKSCGSHGVINFVTLFGEIFGSPSDPKASELLMSNSNKPPKDIKLFDYMKFYAKTVYGGCLTRIMLKSYKIESHQGLMEIQDLDEILSVGKFTRMSDQQMFELARDLDLAEDKYEAKKMYRIIEDSKHLTPGSKTKGLFTQLEFTCQKYRNKLANNFDAYNLARALLGPKAVQIKPEVTFLKLNEYSRLCTQFQDSRLREQVRENMRTNMKRTWVKGFLYGKNA